MALSVFLTTFAVIFLAEFGDKTQLIALALAARFDWKKVFLGIALAFTVLNAAAVGVGFALFEYLPHRWIEAASAALFLFFAVRTLRAEHDDDDDERSHEEKRRGPVATAFLLILLAELGDKTQIITATLAAESQAPVSVFVGSTLALWIVSLLGVLVGAQFARRVPMKWVHRAAGLAFLAFGVYTAWQAAGSFGLLKGSP